MKYRISGGVLLSGGKEQRGDLLLANGRIEAILAPDAPSDDTYCRVDASGCYVSPGFVDIHQHGGGGGDYMDEDPDTYLKITEAHLAHGTTAVMPTLLSADPAALLRAVERYQSAACDPRIRVGLIGLHIEGPYISPHQAGAQKKEHIRPFDAAEYEQVIRVGQGAVKRWSVAPEVEGAERFASFARDNGVTLSIAHSNADLDTVVRAFDWGFHHVTHLYSCISTITRQGGFRVPGVLEAAYDLDEMDVEIIADGCHLPPSLLRFVTKFKRVDRIALITDAMRAAGQNVSHSFLGSEKDPTPCIIEDGVAKLEDRSAFAGSVATADRLVRQMMAIGIAPAVAVQMMSENPLRMMGLSLGKGALKTGYDADVCIFDRDVHMKTVFCGGRKIF